MADSKLGPSASTSNDTDKQSYYQIYVPEFATNPNITTKSGAPVSGSELMSSFLRLGASIDDPITTHGAELLELVEDGSVFADDERDRGPNYVAHGALNGHKLSPEQRKKESEALLTKGGWRDHSDGNRISTTYGDKVEIIRGNYKLIVLGRQGDPELGVVEDYSGGLKQDDGIARYQWVNLSWAEDPNGTWRVTEESEKDSVHSIVHGEVVEEFYGATMTSITGSETPQVGLKLAGGVSEQKQKNPVIVERTWAESIASYTGSDKCWVPTINEFTYAGAINSVTHAGAMADTTTSGVIAETTNAGQITSTTTVGQMTEVTAATQMTSTTTVGQVLEHTTAGQMTSITIAPGGVLEVLATAQPAVSVQVGTKLDVFAGAWAIDVTLAPKCEFQIGPSAEFSFPNYEETFAKKLETALAKSEITLDMTTTAVKNTATSMSATIAAINVKIGNP